MKLSSLDVIQIPFSLSILISLSVNRPSVVLIIPLLTGQFTPSKSESESKHFYRPKQSFGQGNIFTPMCHSVHRGEYLTRHVPPQARHTPPRQDMPPTDQTHTPHRPDMPPRPDPPGPDMPPQTRHAPDQTPPDQTHTPGPDTPPRPDTPLPPGLSTPPRD